MNERCPKCGEIFEPPNGHPPGIVRGPGWAHALAVAKGELAPDGAEPAFEVLDPDRALVGEAADLPGLMAIARDMQGREPALYEVFCGGDPWGQMDVSRSSYRVVGDGGKTTLVLGAIII